LVEFGDEAVTPRSELGQPSPSALGGYEMAFLLGCGKGTLVSLALGVCPAGQAVHVRAGFVQVDVERAEIRVLDQLGSLAQELVGPFEVAAASHDLGS
jgi:hypothetical protein